MNISSYIYIRFFVVFKECDEICHLQQLAAMREEVLYVISLDLTKAYDALDRSRSLEILKGYGVEQRVRRMLREY